MSITTRKENAKTLKTLGQIISLYLQSLAQANETDLQTTFQCNFKLSFSHRKMLGRSFGETSTNTTESEIDDLTNCTFSVFLHAFTIIFKYLDVPLYRFMIESTIQCDTTNIYLHQLVFNAGISLKLLPSTFTHWYTNLETIHITRKFLTALITGLRTLYFGHKSKPLWRKF